MYRIDNVSTEEVDALASWLDLVVRPDEREAIRSQVNGLRSLFEDLEDITAPRSDAERSDRFHTQPYAPSAEEDPYNAWIRKVDLDRRTAGLLSGHSVAIKDCVSVRGVQSTWGTRALEGFVPERHAPVVDALLDAGATIAGKTNLDELTFAPTGETSGYGPTRNPADPDHIAGGSSSGSAAAVAAGDVDLAVGTDTGGSIRMPGSFCGIVGHKPTFGLVPRDGVFRITHTMDHVGPMARDVSTVARGLEAMTPHRNGPAYHEDLGRDLSSVTVGIVPEYFGPHVDGHVEDAVRAAIEELDSLGATVQEVPVPVLEHSRPTWWAIAPVEFAIMYATADVRLDPRSRMAPDIARAIRRLQSGDSRAIGRVRRGLLVLGAHLLRTHGGSHYVRGQQVRQSLIEDFQGAFESVDVIAAPTTPMTALELGEFERGKTRPINRNTHPTNLTGHPSLTLPCGPSDDLPIGLQLIADYDRDRTILDVGAVYEEAR